MSLFAIFRDCFEKSALFIIVALIRSQNDELRAEIEAQSAAHKAQINAAEARAHDSWLATKQTERRLEEAKAEATVLRKRLTTISFNASGESSMPNR